jgi:hypothetical protein
VRAGNDPPGRPTRAFSGTDERPLVEGLDLASTATAWQVNGCLLLRRRLRREGEPPSESGSPSSSDGVSYPLMNELIQSRTSGMSTRLE